LQNLLNEKVFNTKQELARAIGKTSAYVSKILSILKLENEIIKDLEDHKSVKDLEVLYELQKIKDPKIQIKLYYKIIEGNFTRNELREYNKKVKQGLENKVVKEEVKPFTLNITKKVISFKYPIKNIKKEDISNFENDINKLLEKYTKK